MKYEFLLSMENCKVISAQEQDDSQWGKLEIPEEGFFYIEFECEPHCLHYLQSEYTWNGEKFIHNELGIEFDTILAPKEDVDYVEKEQIECADKIDADWRDKYSSPCECICNGFKGEDMGTRLYWFKKFALLKDLEGMEEFLKAIRGGAYSKIWKAGKVFTKETWNTIMSNEVFNDEDKNWMKRLWQLQ